MTLAGDVVVGARVRLAATFAGTGNQAADPTDVVCRVRDPAGVVTAYDWNPGAIARAGTGQFTLDLTVAVAGIWYARWEGSGAIVAVTETTFAVVPSHVI